VGVSRSGFYAWLGRPPSARAVSDAELAGMIVQIHNRSRCTYGAPRVHAELARLGWRCGRKRVARLMRSQQLVGVHARRRWRRGRPDAAMAPDLVQRNFNPTGPDRLWAADVTQFRTGEGWLHLAAVIDLWSRRVVGWAMGTTANAELVTDALVMAFQRRRPDRRVVHHSDRGAAYTSLAFSQRVVELEVDQSFGSTGDCYDCEDPGAVVEPSLAGSPTSLLGVA
jgi:putative transposase